MGTLQERAVEAFLDSRVRVCLGNSTPRSDSLGLGDWGRGKLVRPRTCGGDLDARHAALGNGRSDGQRMTPDSDECKKARGGTLHGFLHVLAEMAHLGLRGTVGEIAGASWSCVRCGVSKAYGRYVFSSNQDMERVRSGCQGRVVTKV